MTLYLYTNILNVDTLLFLSHICLRTFDFIAYCHFVFVTIIPTHRVFALFYFIPPKHKAGRFVFFAWGWCKMCRPVKYVFSGNQTSIVAVIPKPYGNTQNDKTSTVKSKYLVSAIQFNPFRFRNLANTACTHYHYAFL